MIDPVTGMLIGQGVNALAGIYGANSAADAQQDAARKQADTARRNFMAQTTLAEPARGVGYQALRDMAGLYGYSTPAYAPLSAVQNAMNPLGAKAVKKGLKRGMSVDDLAGMGTINQRTMRRLIKAGMSTEDIGKLQGRQPDFAPDGSTGNNPPISAQSIMDRITQMPGYQFGMKEGTGALEQSAANRGGLFSGDAGKSLFSWGRDYSASKFGEDWNRMSQLAGIGAQGNAQASGATNSTANSLMGAQQQVGDARASGVLGTTNSIGNAVNSGVNNYLMWQLINRQPPAPTGNTAAIMPYTRGY